MLYIEIRSRVAVRSSCKYTVFEWYPKDYPLKSHCAAQNKPASTLDMIDIQTPITTAGIVCSCRLNMLQAEYAQAIAKAIIMPIEDPFSIPCAKAQPITPKKHSAIAMMSTL